MNTGGNSPVSDEQMREKAQYISKSTYGSVNGGPVGPGDCCGTATQAMRPDPRMLIVERIDYYNRKTDRLSALLRALPAEMSCMAEAALLDLLHDSRPRY